MQRVIVRPNQVPLDTDFLRSQRYAYTAFSRFVETVIGTTTALAGLPCAPVSPAGLKVVVSAGAIYSAQPLDVTDYGSLPADASKTIVKQAELADPVVLNTPAPTTAGHAINYLVQVALQTEDVDPVVRQYFNAAAPATPLMGSNNSGVPDATTRMDRCVVTVKAGASATAGAQATPTPDAGFVPAYVVTVLQGQTAIIADNIVVAPGAPFITTNLGTSGLAERTAIQRQAYVYGVDTGIPNACVIALSPPPAAYTDGMRLSFRVKHANTGATTLNVSALGPAPIRYWDGVSLAAGALQANAIVDVVYSSIAAGFVLRPPGLDRSRNLADLADKAAAKQELGISGDMLGHMDQEYVHRAGNEDIGGHKTFKGGLTIEGTNAAPTPNANQSGAIANVAFVNSAVAAALATATAAAQTAQTAGVNAGANALTVAQQALAAADGAASAAADALTRWQPGDVKMRAFGTVPTGWYECNGQAVSRTADAALFQAIGTIYGPGDNSTTFNLPDLRGEFVRGWDHGRGVDANRALGSTQSDMFKSHTHQIGAATEDYDQHNGPLGTTLDAVDTGTGPAHVTSGQIKSTGGDETRPRNVAMMFIIKR